MKVLLFSMFVMFILISPAASAQNLDNVFLWRDWIFGFAFQVMNIPAQSHIMECNAGEIKECGSNVGRCISGYRKCTSDGIWSEYCINSIGPTSELPNGVDDDCDGLVDENFIQPSQNTPTQPTQEAPSAPTEETPSIEEPIEQTPENYVKGENISTTNVTQIPKQPEFTDNTTQHNRTNATFGYIAVFEGKPISLYQKELNQGIEGIESNIKKLKQEYESVDINGFNFFLNFFYRISKASELSGVMLKYNRLKLPILRKINTYKAQLSQQHSIVKQKFPYKIIDEYLIENNTLVLDITRAECDALKAQGYVKDCYPNYIT